MVGGARPEPFLAACTLALAANVLRGLRWSRLLGGSAGRWRCVGAFMSALAINNMAPLRIGDVLRGAALSGAPGTSAAHGLAAVALERLIDLTAIAAIGAIGAGLLGLPASPVLAAIAGGGALTLILVARSSPRLERLRASVGWRLHIGRAAQAMHAIRSGHRLAPILGLTMASWCAEACAIRYAGTAIAWDPGWIGAIWLCTAGTLATALPAAPGAIGTMHAAIAWAAVVAGAGQIDAVALAIAAHAAIWLPATVVGTVWLVSRCGMGNRPPPATSEP